MLTLLARRRTRRAGRATSPGWSRSSGACSTTGSSVLDIAEDLDAAGRELLAMVAEGWDPVAHASASTVHVSVVDEHGMACATTASAGYGSGATIPGTGILLNNCLGEPELNRRGVHALTPGTRMASNMAPSVGRHVDGSVLAIGSPGADRITTALAQVLAGYALGGLDLQAAVDAPRLHVRHLADARGPLRGRSAVGGPVRVDYEADLAMPDVGLPTYEHPARSMFFGGVAAALVRPGRSPGGGGRPSPGRGRRRLPQLTSSAADWLARLGRCLAGVGQPAFWNGDSPVVALGLRRGPGNAAGRGVGRDAGVRRDARTGVGLVGVGGLVGGQGEVSGVADGCSWWGRARRVVASAVAR